MGGVAAAAVGMMFRLGMTSARGGYRHIPSLLVLVATFIAIGIMQWPLLPVLLVLAPLSIASSGHENHRRSRPPMRDDPLIQLIIVIAPLSLLAIGGASAIYAPLQQQSVAVYQWVSAREYLELFAIARVTPGPGSMLDDADRLEGRGPARRAGGDARALHPLLGAVLRRGAHLNRHRGTKWHTAIENGLRPIGAGLMIAGGVMILRIESAGWLGWAVAFAVTAFMTWRHGAPDAATRHRRRDLLAVRAVTG